MSDLHAETTPETLERCWFHTLEIFAEHWNKAQELFLDANYNAAFLHMSAAAHLAQDLAALARAMDESL